MTPTTEATIRGIAEEVVEFFAERYNENIWSKDVDKVVAIISRALSASVPEQSVLDSAVALDGNRYPLPAACCKWTLVEEVKGEHPNLYRSDCGIMMTRRQEWWKYCQLCGKEIE